MKSLRLSSRRAIVAVALALTMFMPAIALAEQECITETITRRYYLFGYEVFSTEKTTTVCTEIRGT
jgi:hypothetical protein